jgi:hypothetical protein
MMYPRSIFKFLEFIFYTMDSVSAMKKDDGYHQKGRWRAYQDREIPIYMITNSLTAFQTKLPTRRHHHFKA